LSEPRTAAQGHPLSDLCFQVSGIIGRLIDLAPHRFFSDTAVAGPAPLNPIIKESHLDHDRPSVRAVVVSTVNERKQVVFSEIAPSDHAEFTLGQFRKVLTAQAERKVALTHIAYTDDVRKLAPG